MSCDFTSFFLPVMVEVLNAKRPEMFVFKGSIRVGIYLPDFHKLDGWCSCEFGCVHG